MNKLLIVYIIAMLGVSLDLGSYVQATTEDSDKTDNSTNSKIQEFSESYVLQSNSTTSICHVPKGNQDKSHEIVVNTSSLTNHLNHGDVIGTCEG